VLTDPIDPRFVPDAASLHPNAVLVQAALTQRGAVHAVRELTGRAGTAAEAAALLNVEVGQIASSLLFEAVDTLSAEAGSGLPVLVMTSGQHRANPAAIAEIVGVQHIRRPDADFVRRHTGQPIGGVAPVGHPAQVRTLVDVTLSTFDVVWAAGGHPHFVFPTTFDELVTLTNGAPAEIAARG